MTATADASLLPPCPALPPFRPWLHARAAFDVGMRPVETGGWLVITPDHGAFMAAKRDRLHTDPGRHYRALPEAAAAGAELFAMVLAQLGAHHGAVYRQGAAGLRDLACGTCHPLAPGPDPLLALGRIVEEDFVILDRGGPKPRLVAACNAFSSSGRIVASVGRDMDFAHAPVPGLNAALGRRVDRILANLRPGGVTERFNWFVTAIADRLFPDTAHAANQTAAETAAAVLRDTPERCGTLLWLRVERQTLRALPVTGHVTFAINTFSTPLAAISRSRNDLEALAALIEDYDTARLNYGAMLPIRRILLEWLQGCLRALDAEAPCPETLR